MTDLTELLARHREMLESAQGTGWADVTLNDPDVALALNAVADVWFRFSDEWRAGPAPLPARRISQFIIEAAPYLTHLHEVLQAKMGEQG